MIGSRVSVVMAVLNASRYLKESLASAKQQSVPPHEIIVVDGGSTDATREIAASFPGIRLLRQKTRGFALAWNEGIQAAEGDLVALLDADDRWRPEKLRLQLARMDRSPSVDVVLGHLQFFTTGTAPRHFKPDLLERAHRGLTPGALLARRSVFDRVGWFEERWAIAGDVDWFARLLDSGLPYAVLDEVVLEKRVHDSNLSYTAARTPLVRREILDALRASVARKRARDRS